MKSLIISVDYPLPEDKGNRMRTMHFVRALKHHGDVDLMCYKSHLPLNELETPFRKEYHVEFKYPSGSSDTNKISSACRKLFQSKPFIVNNYDENTVRNICDFIISEDYDVILCRYAVNAFPLLTLPDKYKQRVILDLDDVMSDDLYDAVNGKKYGLMKLKTYIDKIIYKRYQIKCLEFGAITLCSESDRAKITKYIKTPKLHVVPNIAPKQQIPLSYNKNGHDNKSLLFVGVLSYQPNEIGIIWFINEIFNKLPVNFQDMSLMVVGKDPRDNLKQICEQNQRIELIANPPDVVPYFEKCFAVVVPVLIGGGTRIKILEAGDCFRPVISTHLGAYGLDLVEYENVLYFDDHPSFVDRLTWLKDEENHFKITSNLKDIVKSTYTEDAFRSNVGKLLSRLR